ncbi:Ies6 protein [Saccharomycopsis crataegensis]|uniref:Ies6 protein n=1 Tax=Saccharomycopsis crataegensis TaxID=43959 RepID=A0AAV5QNY3_9ASCO|nr:Ies6 protein [Saccharomycopsis crataegensis]
MSSLSDTVVSAAINRPLSFKNPKYNPSRRHKPHRQLVSDEQKRLATLTLPVDAVTYFSVEAYPPLRPQKHYCDITGLKGHYKAPSSGLRFANAEVYQVVRTMAQGVDQQYLELRNANVVLK